MEWKNKTNQNIGSKLNKMNKYKEYKIKITRRH